MISPTGCTGIMLLSARGPKCDVRPSGVFRILERGQGLSAESARGREVGAGEGVSPPDVV